MKKEKKKRAKVRAEGDSKEYIQARWRERDQCHSLKKER